MPGDEQRAVRHKLIACWRYYVEQLAALADRLQAQVLDDGSTLLDNTLILWCSEMGAGDTHSLKDMPLVAIGGGAHGFQQGVSVDFGGKQINDVHSTIPGCLRLPGGALRAPRPYEWPGRRLARQRVSWASTSAGSSTTAGGSDAKLLVRTQVGRTRNQVMPGQDARSRPSGKAS